MATMVRTVIPPGLTSATARSVKAPFCAMAPLGLCCPYLAGLDAFPHMLRAHDRHIASPAKRRAHSQDEQSPGDPDQPRGVAAPGERAGRILDDPGEPGREERAEEGRAVREAVGRPQDLFRHQCGRER